MTSLDLFRLVAGLAKLVTWTYLGYRLGLRKGRDEKYEPRPDGWVIHTLVRLRSPIHTKGGEH